MLCSGQLWDIEALKSQYFQILEDHSLNGRRLEDGGSEFRETEYNLKCYTWNGRVNKSTQ